jgi:hypothetical protein
MPITHSALRSFVLCLVLISLVPASASAVDLMVGWTRSDIGLDGNDEGISAVVSHYLPMGDSGSFTMGLEVAYVQRAGSQPELFTSNIAPMTSGERQVTLHILQPGVTLGYTLATGSWDWRVYAGAALGLKLDETQELPEGDWIDLEPYGYEDIDYLAMVGLTARMGRLVLDFRYNAGLTDQLILRNELNYPLDKAGEDNFPGVDDPVTGAKLSNIQLGVGFGF